jgi:hypothetical protein
VTHIFVAPIFHTDRDEEAAKADGASQNRSPTQHLSDFSAYGVDWYEICGLGGENREPFFLIVKQFLIELF